MTTRNSYISYNSYFKKVSHSRYIRGEVTRATGRKIPGRGGAAGEEGGGETIASGEAARVSDDCRCEGFLMYSQESCSQFVNTFDIEPYLWNNVSY